MCDQDQDPRRNWSRSGPAGHSSQVAARRSSTGSIPVLSRGLARRAFSERVQRVWVDFIWHDDAHPKSVWQPRQGIVRTCHVTTGELSPTLWLPRSPRKETSEHVLVDRRNQQCGTNGPSVVSLQYRLSLHGPSHLEKSVQFLHSIPSIKSPW